MEGGGALPLRANRAVDEALHADRNRTDTHNHTHNLWSSLASDAALPPIENADAVDLLTSASTRARPLRVPFVPSAPSTLLARSMALAADSAVSVARDGRAGGGSAGGEGALSSRSNAAADSERLRRGGAFVASALHRTVCVPWGRGGGVAGFFSASLADGASHSKGANTGRILAADAAIALRSAHADKVALRALDQERKRLGDMTRSEFAKVAADAKGGEATRNQAARNARRAVIKGDSLDAPPPLPPQQISLYHLAQLAIQNNVYKGSAEEFDDRVKR